MMYAALAVAAVGLLAWDFGRRWLHSYERAKEAALIRVAEWRNEFGDSIEAIHDRLDRFAADAAKGALQLRNDLGTELGVLRARSYDVEKSVDDLSSQVGRHAARLDRLGSDHVELEKNAGVALNGLTARVDSLDKLAAAPREQADVTELRAAIETQEKALKNFWGLIGQQFASKEELKTETDKLRAGQSAVLASGGMPGMARRR